MAGNKPGASRAGQGGVQMKYVKILSLAAVAAMALMAFAAGSASATSLYNGTEKLSNTATLDFSIPSGGSANLVDTSGTSLDKCSTSTAKGALTTNEGTPSGNLSELTWGSCSFPTKTLTLGGLKVTQLLDKEGKPTTNGKVESNATIEVTINTILFGSCVYGVEKNTEIGTLTTAAAGTATFDANAVAKRLTGSQAACPETSKWTGSYTGTTPDQLRVEEK
jgi:hypothetical protein